MAYVVATAGHVDHGKSTLVRALTGIEPDRWAEERRRGLTIDLGYAWTTLPRGAHVAFVDVPGHQRFVGNMLAGLGPAPVVLFVVAADEGWRAQSDEHRDAVAALGIDRGVVALTRADRATPEQLAATRTQVAEGLAGTGLADAPVVAVSAVTRAGLPSLVAALEDVLTATPAPAAGRLRLWVDRSFSVAGAGTVVTGTLATGAIAVGDEVELLGRYGARAATVRRIESEGGHRDLAEPVRRVALNLRGPSADEVGRGDAVVAPGTWQTSALVDVRRTRGPEGPLPEQLRLHVGTAAVPVRGRPLGDAHLRLRLEHPLPLAIGDRLVLRDPGSGLVVGALVLDADPPELRRRGDAARRAEVLASRGPDGDLAAEVARRGAVPVARLRLLGLLATDAAEPPAGVLAEQGWWVDATSCAGWADRLARAVADNHEHDPLAVGLSRGAVRAAAGVPADELVDLVVRTAGLVAEGGYVRAADRPAGLGPAEAAVATLEERLAEHPFAAPEADDLTRLGLGPRELAAAERQGRLLRVAPGVVLLPTGPVAAMRVLSGLDQPFTASAARQALGTTRRVLIPLLEHLDGRGWTRRVDGGAAREVVR
ncbi:selenocysteine-specific translation elongation factor [Pimelobacter simplex]|uniref:Selenocysteine-specific translation elongation factor n=1 Tax=Nocardioides simplex TaxID=2045 RepID=A0A0A1DH31_NOCSI|nr:selenocysteine-specific translation elongation factor [Pimelobacter simplex]AIY16604.1 Selenocysteine-specific translation elongation factor [Pimelobacter simplex]MCG8154009.1 selenocysteine-specific translation elongation factor [Pimelobacter simplex]GEB15416.1 selenocysteine-specific translation elongation factor [Pimelobacter simplex]SFN14810.1 selenocysteine-specific elongation factor [Pimelobacter simplex]